VTGNGVRAFRSRPGAFTKIGREPRSDRTWSAWAGGGQPGRSSAIPARISRRLEFAVAAPGAGLAVSLAWSWSWRCLSSSLRCARPHRGAWSMTGSSERPGSLSSYSTVRSGAPVTGRLQTSPSRSSTEGFRPAPRTPRSRGTRPRGSSRLPEDRRRQPAVKAPWGLTTVTAVEVRGLPVHLHG